MISAMLNLPSGVMTPIADDDEVVFFDDRLQAAEAIKNNLLGAKYGGMVFDTDEDGTDV